MSEHPGYGAVLVGLIILSAASCQDDNVKKLIQAMDRQTAAIEGLAKPSSEAK